MQRISLCWHARAVWLAVVAVLFMADQATKHWASTTIPLQGVIPVFEGFNFVHWLNPGAAFSFLANAGGWQKYFFIGIGIVVTLMFTVASLMGYFSRLEFWGATGITAGGLGNVADRISTGYVVDFLDFYWRSWHWPAFNFADISIVCGAFLFIVSSFRTNTASQ